jgi:4a-hydroxytetrahydrobiopterin dehydratase
MKNLNLNIKIMNTGTTDLAEKKCVPCEGGTPVLDEHEIAVLEKQIADDWKVVENKKLFREFSFVNYKHTMDFVNKVAAIAEEEGHHPDMHVHFGSVEIELWTHAIDGLSENDFILAAKIDRL